MQALNRVQLVGVLPRNPEMRYTPKGTAVTSFTVLTYRGWKDNGGQSKESPEYSNVVVWSKLAEICNQLLTAGSKVFIEGRLQTRTWDDDAGVKYYRTEIVADDMVLLSGRDGGQQLAEDQIRIESDESLNRVQVIGNLARDPELRYLDSGTGVCTFVIATNRSWTNSAGERQESTEFHNVVCWNEIAKRVSEDLRKGAKAMVEGRLQNRSWQGEDGVKRYKTEIVGEFIVTPSDDAGANNERVASSSPSTSTPTDKNSNSANNDSSDDFDLDSSFDDIFSDSDNSNDNDNKSSMAF